MVKTVRSTFRRLTGAFKPRNEPLFGDLSKEKLQKLWLVGTLDRLSSMGFITNCPFRLRDQCNDLFLCLDPDKLFQSDHDVVESLRVIIKEDTPGGDTIPDWETLAMGELILSFKEDPQTLAKIYLESNEKNLL